MALTNRAEVKKEIKEVFEKHCYKVKSIQYMECGKHRDWQSYLVLAYIGRIPYVFDVTYYEDCFDGEENHNLKIFANNMHTDSCETSKITFWND